MDDSQHLTFEKLLEMAEALSVPNTDNEREVRWCDSSGVLGLSRQHGGGIEIFLCGVELQAQLPLVRRHLKYDGWAHKDGGVFRANRLVFPSNDYYVPATAFLAEELLRTNLIGALSQSFSQTEPLIEMVLRKTALSEEAILGLLGELRFLEVLLTLSTDVRQKAEMLDGWQGHQRGARDFVYGNRSAEIKATRSGRSVHAISSIAQVDPRRTESGDSLEELHLVSVGFQPCDPAQNDVGISLADQVETILQKLAVPGRSEERGELQQQFLGKVSMYGGEAGHGYDHDEMRDWSAYIRRWEHRFLRIYNMTDPAIQVLRKGDVLCRQHVVLDSVTFQISLPDSVTGDINPQLDPFDFGRSFLHSSSRG